MTRVLGFFRQIHTTAGPAGTLLLVSVLLALLTSFARATPVAPRLAPGAVFTVTVALPEQGPVVAYLPGLDLRRVPLRFDGALGRYVGALTLPWYAPHRGWATLRIVAGGLTLDHRLPLGRVDAS